MSTLDPADEAGVRALVARARDADGVAPLNEQALLALRGSGRPRHHVVRDGAGIVGYAQADPGAGTAQLVVDPRHRRAGHGSALLNALAADGSLPVWAFGDLPAARAFAASRGLTPVRGLVVMARPLAPTPEPQLPAGLTLRGFTPDDAEAFLALNARAFAGHPEQGRFSLADLTARMAEPWFVPAGLILAVDATGLVGFHWTKRHPGTTGEVYVLGVDPKAQGRGLGKLLLQAGLAHLAAQGCTEVILYAEADNAPAVALYRAAGFEVRNTDVLYASRASTPARPHDTNEVTPAPDAATGLPQR